MKLRQDHPIEVAAAKAGMSQATGYRISQDPELPSQKPQSRGREDVAESGLRIDIADLRGDDQRINKGGAIIARLGASEEP